MRPAAGLRGGMLHTHVERGSSNREAPTLATQVLLARFVQRESKSSRKIPAAQLTIVHGRLLLLLLLQRGM